jgi:hypothetical protein
MTPPTSPTPDSNSQPWTSPFEELLDHGKAEPGHSVGAGDNHHPHSVIGTPDQDIAFWEGKQLLSDDCAIKCQQFILEQFTGQHITEGTLVGEAMDHGWYAAGGTEWAKIGNLLELHGVGVSHFENANQYDLADELAHGHKVIVGVEAGTLWNNGQHSGHAVVVSGIDTSDPDHMLVQVSDPGTGEALHAYPMEQFLDAWRGSHFTMVATQDPAPAHLPEMAHFDYETGHIHEIAGMPYDQFTTYADHPDQFGEIVHHFVEHFLDSLGDHILDAVFHDHTASAHDDDPTGMLDHVGVHHDPLLDPHHDQHHDPLLDPPHDHDAGHDHVDPTDHLHDGHVPHDLI